MKQYKEVLRGKNFVITVNDSKILVEWNDRNNWINIDANNENELLISDTLSVNWKDLGIAENVWREKFIRLVENERKFSSLMEILREVIKDSALIERMNSILKKQ